MAKNRMVNTRYWTDNYISDLDPSEKLLFIYCLTNPYTDICGVYEIPIKYIALETGLDKDMVIKILDRFEADNKIFYQKGWIGIKNFHKYQLKNPKVMAGIENGLKQAPKEILDRLSIDYDRLSHSNSNLNSNSNTKIRVAKATNLGTYKKYLDEVPEEDIKELVKNYNCTKDQVVNEANEMRLWVDGYKKKIPNYKKAFELRVAKKYGVRKKDYLKM